MKKIVPFKKEFELQTNISELISIELDNDLKLNESKVLGNLYINGSYKMNEASVNVEEFKFKIPVNIEMSKHYNLDNMTIEIDDFYYEILDNKKLNVNIEIALDNLEELKFPFKEIETIKEASVEEIKEPEIKEKKKDENRETKENNLNEEYSTYHVYVVKDNETIENIISKYKITKDTLEQYNELNDIKSGDKLIIPDNETSK